MTLAQMIEQLNGLQGLDLTTTEATDLLNEGYRELCARSEWLRATSTAAGPTVVDQSEYTLPSDLYRVLKVFVDGRPYYGADETTVAHIEANNLSYSAPSGSHLYWLNGDGTGADRLSLHPAPGEAGLTIALRYVRRPTALTTADEPLTPREFDRAIIDYAGYLAYSLLEDDEGMADVRLARFERKVEELRRLRNSRGGRAPIQMRVIGHHV